MPTLEIAGSSGKKHKFSVYPYNSEWNEVGAVYVVTKRTAKPNGSGTHKFLYVGQTDNLKERHSAHHKATCFSRNGANSLCVLTESSKKKRLSIEADLLDAHNWPCND